MPTPFSPSTALADARLAALTAWHRIHHFHRGEFEIYHKQDGPATDADRLADEVIVEFLRARYDDATTGYLTEESENDDSRLEKEVAWIIDPIDGTTDFIKGGDDFALHIAAVARDVSGSHCMAAAVVYHPRAGLLYSAIAGGGAHVEREQREDGEPFWWEREGVTPEMAAFNAPEPITVTTNAALGDLTAVVSRSHPTVRLRAALDTLPIKGHYRRGSLGVKIMEVAAGRADFYLHTETGMCKEWDLCAPHLILAEAGGRVSNMLGEPRTYNQADVLVHGGVLATNGAAHAALVAALREVPGLVE